MNLRHIAKAIALVYDLGLLLCLSTNSCINFIKSSDSIEEPCTSKESIDSDSFEDFPEEFSNRETKTSFKKSKHLFTPFKMLSKPTKNIPKSIIDIAVVINI